MNTKYIVILGAGISGLATAWFLKQKYGSKIHLSILEANSNCGGWIQTEQQNGFLFEKGPRSFRTNNIGAATLQLIKDLGLQEQIIAADPSASNRFIYTERKLQKIPDRFWKIPFSHLTKGWCKSLWKDLTAQKGSGNDESIYEFFSRHIGSTWTKRFIDPLVSGIFAGNIDQLSLKSCFPLIYDLEQQQRSLLKGLLFNKKSPHLTDNKRDLPNAAIFSFRKGMSTLVEALSDRLADSIQLNQNVDQLILNSDNVLLKMSNGTEIKADHLISAIPAYSLSQLLKATHPFLSADLDKINYASLMVVNCGYEKSVLKQKGFGYLVPSQDQENNILGCIWDSEVFPQQNLIPEATRLTVMMGGVHHPDILEWSEEKGMAMVLAGLEKQLGIYSLPDSISISMARQAIPQYEIGYTQLLSHIHEQISFITSNLTCIGSAFNGVSVNDCIQAAYHKAQNLESI